ncbi:potassium/proton antiporter [Terribacillus saccharophilus]|uniref:K+/H+ antiporter n=1 Tax=Terribacillus saccharophilus TaxID=361277 RepID=A0A268ABY2_9BACI|nr:potassium/proton antiporter [Terribacillus saccharophilus]PAD21630.1 K+/H+ antiporter [Terribacillus saccharophilus]
MHDYMVTNQFIFLFALLLIVSVVVTKFSTRLGVPALVLFIAVGMIVGSDGFGLVYFDNAHLAEAIGIFALIVILFEGGLHANWNSMKPALAPAITMATIGVLLTAAIVAVAAHYIFDLTWLESVLIGSIVGSTDAAAVFSVLKGQNVKEKLAATLEAESGTNDPMAMFLTITCIELISGHGSGVLSLIGSFIWEMGAGAAMGLLIGFIAVRAINRINLDTSGLYPLFALAFALVSYGLTSVIHASGLLAVYVSALYIGNAEITYRRSIIRFNEGFGWLMQICMFVLLGLFVFPGELFTPSLMVKGFLLSIVLIFLARPLATFLSMLPFKYTAKEKVFISWAGLKGAVPIVLALFPLIAGIENAQLIFNAVFFVVLLSTVLQGSTVTALAAKLKLVQPPTTNEIETLELISIGRNNLEMVEYKPTDLNEITGKRLEDLSFPETTLINAILRSGEIISPNGQTVIKAGDTLYIMVSLQFKKQLAKYLRRNKLTEE